MLNQGKEIYKQEDKIYIYILFKLQLWRFLEEREEVWNISKLL